MEFALIALLLLSFPIIAIVALVKAVNLNDRLRIVEGQLARFAHPLPGAAPAAAPRPTAAPPDAASATPAEPLPGASSEPIPAAAPTPPPELEPAVGVLPPPPPPPTAPAGPGRQISFEERFGTRWTVWIGGVALALGGIFLVKYS